MAKPSGTRRLDAVNLNIAAALRAMRSGAALHFEYTRNGPRWLLSNGMKLTPEVARAIVSAPNVVVVDHALFKDTTAQTWRYAWTEAS
jgi:hypothetical protein